jgi:hypothetical protein
MQESLALSCIGLEFGASLNRVPTKSVLHSPLHSPHKLGMFSPIAREALNNRLHTKTLKKKAHENTSFWVKLFLVRLAVKAAVLVAGARTRTDTINYFWGHPFGAQLIILFLIHNYFPGNFCGISWVYLTLNVANVGMQ